MPYADISQYVLASEAIPEIARCYFGGDTSKAESDARIAAQEGALPVFRDTPFLHINRDRWYHDHIPWSSIFDPHYFPRADLLKIYPDLWQSLQSPDNETTLIAVPEGAPDSDTAQSDAIDVDTLGADQTDAGVTRGNTQEADSSDDAGNQKFESANLRRGNPKCIRGPYYEPLRKRLSSQAKLLEKNEESLAIWFDNLQPREFCTLVKPALDGINLPTDRTLYDAGRQIVDEIENR